MKKLLRQMPIFADCEDDELQILAKIADLKQYVKGSILSEAGQPCDDSQEHPAARRKAAGVRHNEGFAGARTSCVMRDRSALS